MVFKEILKEKRRAFGFTQEQLAKELNVSRSAISNWEIGRNYPDIETLLILANLFQVPLDDLLNEDVKVVEAVAHDLSKKRKFKTAAIGLASFLVLAIGLIVFLLAPKTPTIERIKETAPKDSEVVPFKEKEFKEIYVEDETLKIIFDVPKKELGYYMDVIDGELTLSMYKIKENKEDLKKQIIPYQALFSLDLSQYGKIKTIKVSYL